MTPHTTGRVRIGLVLLVGILLQTTIASDLRVIGVAPDFMILLTVCAGMLGGPRQGLVVGFCAGLLEDLFLTNTPLGLAALTFCIVGVTVGALRAAVLSESRVLVPPIAFIATAAGVTLFVLVGDLVGQSQLIAPGHAWLIKVAIVESGWSLVLSLPFSWVFARAAKGTEGAEELDTGRPDRIGVR